MQLSLETLDYVSMAQFLGQCFVFGLGIGYAWRVYCHFTGG